jgi:alanine dehydrogenase
LVPLPEPSEKVLKQVVDQADLYEVSAVIVGEITIPDLLSREVGEEVKKDSVIV